jgi:hypothetical protein
MEIAEQVVGAARGDWGRLRFTLSTAGATTAATLVAEAAGRGGPLETVTLDPPTAALLLGRRLRAVTAAPDRGAWFTCTVTVATDPAVEVDYDYNGRPWIVPEPGPEAYAEDLARFPRELRHTPAWLRDALAGREARPTSHRDPRRPRALVGALAAAVVAAVVALVIVAVTVGLGGSGPRSPAAAGPALVAAASDASTTMPSPDPSATRPAGSARVDTPYRGRLGSTSQPGECTLRGRLTADATVTVVPAGGRWLVRLTLPSAMGGGGGPLDLTGALECGHSQSVENPASGVLRLDVGRSFGVRADGRALPVVRRDSYSCRIAGAGLQCFDSVRRRPYTVEFSAAEPPAKVTVVVDPRFVADARFTDLRLGTNVPLNRWKGTSDPWTVGVALG